MKTLHTTVRRNPISETKVGQIFGEQIDVCERDDANGISLAVLNWADNLLKNADSVVLFRSHVIDLCSEVFKRNGVQGFFGEER